MGEWKDWLSEHAVFLAALGQPFKSLVDAIGGWSTPIALVVGALASGVYWAWQQQELIHQLQKEVAALSASAPVDQERCRNLQVDFGALKERLSGIDARLSWIQDRVERTTDKLIQVESESKFHERKDEERFRRGENVKEIFRKKGIN